jgi:ubiquinone/menaquinone biosynthesis C-methylase UbiE
LIAWIMARETRHDNLRAIEALDLRPTDNVLDVGTGHGGALSEITARAPGGVVTGIDPSSLMVELATSRNAAQIRARRVQVLKAGVESLPFPDETFDRAMAVHALYFWPHLDASLKEIARVLKPGGRLALVFRSAADERSVAAFPADVYRFATDTEVVSVLTSLRFAIDRVDTGDRSGPKGPVLVVATKHMS